MQYIPLIFLLLAAAHAFTYALWLKQNKNLLGAAGVYLLIASSIGLSVYRLLSSE